ncbi:MAG: hypothetical protein ABFC34_11890 [Methanobacterium sp.]
MDKKNHCSCSYCHCTHDINCTCECCTAPKPHKNHLRENKKQRAPQDGII